MDRVRAALGSASRNGLPEPKPYVYRGSGRDDITPPRLREQLDRQELEAIEVTPAGKCCQCGYKATSQNHRTLCARYL